MDKVVKYGWVKYRTRWSYRLGDWEYKMVSLPFKKWHMEDFLSEIDNQHSYSEQYRGCDVHRTTKVPKEVIEEHLKRFTSNMNHYSALMFECKKQLGLM